MLLVLSWTAVVFTAAAMIQQQPVSSISGLKNDVPGTNQVPHRRRDIYSYVRYISVVAPDHLLTYAYEARRSVYVMISINTYQPGTR